MDLQRQYLGLEYLFRVFTSVLALIVYSSIFLGHAMGLLWDKGGVVLFKRYDLFVLYLLTSKVRI